MERTTKSQRRMNALNFWNTGWKRAVVIMEKKDSKTNPNIRRCTLVTNVAQHNASPIVIAESVLGKVGALTELLSTINALRAKEVMDCYHVTSYDKFERLLEKYYSIRITYDDDYAMIFER